MSATRKGNNQKSEEPIGPGRLARTPYTNLERSQISQYALIGASYKLHSLGYMDG
jgi:hypothetical protein